MSRDDDSVGGFSRGECGLCHKSVVGPFETMAETFYHPDCAETVRVRLKQTVFEEMRLARAQGPRTSDDTDEDLRPKRSGAKARQDRRPHEA